MRARIVAVIPAIAVLMALLAVAVMVACGESAPYEEVEVTREVSVSAGADGAAGAAATAAPAATTAPAMSQRAPAGPAATAAPRVAQESEEEIAVSRSTGFFQNAPLTEESQSSVVAQNRIIVRTVDMAIIVAEVAPAADEIVGLTRRYGGWVVSSDRSRKHRAGLSVRVPAQSLEEFILTLRQVADKVEFETSTSQDVTDEYVDNQGRLNGLRNTEARLLEFLNRAVNVEEALNVQVELAQIQLEIEMIQGKLRFLSETAAYSLVNLEMTTRPGVMQVDAGPDATFRARRQISFRATFQPPEGIDEFKFTWDFGDGSQAVEGSRTAPTTNQGERVTSTVTHAYNNVQYSPFIVQLNISGIGDAGLYLGSDTLIATVSEIPIIEVFAGEDRVADEGDEVEYSGSFTRPESLTDFKFRWDFGDGSATVFDVPEEGDTRAVTPHTFRDHRPNPYPVTLTVTAQSEAGEISGSSSFNVQVIEVEGFIVAGWDLGNTAKTAIRMLSIVGQALLTILIWVGVFSPVWLAVIAAVILIPRLRRRFGRGSGGRPGQQPRRRETGDGGTYAEAGPPPAEPGPGPQHDSPASDVQEQPSSLCANCGAEVPPLDAQGQPSKFCANCGAEVPALDVQGQPPNA